MGGIILPDGSVYTFDDGSGAWRHVPDVETANAIGLDWNGLAQVDSVPGPVGPDWPSGTTPIPPPSFPPPPPPIAAQAAGASSFVWGGRTWATGELASFVGYLAARGVSYSDWSTNHPDAASILEGPPSDPAREPVPKSVGEALGMAIANGATPAQAAAAASALASSQLAQGFGAPSGAGLLRAAEDVAAAYQAAGGVTPQTPQATDSSRDAYFVSDAIVLDLADDAPERELEGVRVLPAQAWANLRDQLVKDIPYVGVRLRARGRGMKAVVASDLWHGSSS